MAGEVDECAPFSAYRALESLCAAYWYPLYAFVRRRGDSPEQAQDHTQDFFARIREPGYFDRADREKGRSGRSCSRPSRPVFAAPSTTPMR